jgi:hypothetical protein
MPVLSQLFLPASLVLLASFFSAPAAAQSNYQPALVVTSKGDTLHGFINYGEWEGNPKSIEFKSDQAAAPQKLTAASVTFFRVAVNHLAEYEGYAGPISTDNTEINHLSTGRDTSFKTDTIFLRVLQDGKKLKLFSYTDGQKTRFFIAENFSDRPVELTYRIYWNEGEASGAAHTIYETAYKGQLYDEAVKFGVMSPSLKTAISNAEYREDDLVKIAAVINNISAGDLSKNNLRKTKPFHIVLVAVGVIAIVYWVIHDFVGAHH